MLEVDDMTSFKPLVVDSIACRFTLSLSGDGCCDLNLGRDDHRFQRWE